MDLVRVFGENVRKARNLRGLTQEELALDTGIKRSYISDLERGTRNPTVRAVGRLAVALGVKPEDLLKTD